MINTTVNIGKVLDGLLLEQCITKHNPTPAPKRPEFKPHDKVQYVRTNGKVIRGFVDWVSARGSAVYIFDTSGHNKNPVAASASRVTLRK